MKDYDRQSREDWEAQVVNGTACPQDGPEKSLEDIVRDPGTAEAVSLARLAAEAESEKFRRESCRLGRHLINEDTRSGEYCCKHCAKKFKEQTT